MIHGSPSNRGSTTYLVFVLSLAIAPALGCGKTDPGSLKECQDLRARVANCTHRDKAIFQENVEQVLRADISVDELRKNCQRQYVAYGEWCK